jgi:hypothetical protein
MRRAIFTALAIAALWAVVAPANQAVASEHAVVVQDGLSVRMGDFVCDWKCARRWPPRQYWQWDRRPIWDDPWTVLQPTIWGSPEPYVVPADSWARGWHPPWIRYRHARHHH